MVGEPTPSNLDDAIRYWCTELHRDAVRAYPSFERTIRGHLEPEAARYPDLAPIGLVIGSGAEGTNAIVLESRALYVLPLQPGHLRRLDLNGDHPTWVYDLAVSTLRITYLEVARARTLEFVIPDTFRNAAVLFAFMSRAFARDPALYYGNAEALIRGTRSLMSDAGDLFEGD